MAWVYLGLAIGTEVTGILMLRQVSAYATWWGAVIVAAAYAVSFITMYVALRRINVGVVYAVWSGIGMVATTVGGVVLFHERVNALTLVGMGIVVVGIVVMVSSGTLYH